MKKSTCSKILSLLLVLVMCLSLIPATALASDARTPTCTIHVYVNGKAVHSYALDESYCDCELRYGQIDLADLGYGDPTGYSVTVDGATPDYVFSMFGCIYFFSFSDPELVKDGSDVQANVYYTVAEEALPAPEEIVCGTATLRISDGKKPLAGYSVTFTGKKAGYDNQTITAVSGDDGIAIAEDLDVSYNWTYQVDEATYRISFTDNAYTSDHSVRVPEPEKVETGISGRISVYVDGRFWAEKDLLDCNTGRPAGRRGPQRLQPQRHRHRHRRDRPGQRRGPGRLPDGKFHLRLL